METSADETSRVCAACGTPGRGRFCSECGTALVDGRAPARQILRDEAADAVGFDRRLAVTLRDLLIHPIRIVRASMAGDRRTYLPPLRLFLALGGLYMLGLSVVQPYRFDAASLQRSGFRGETAARMESRIRERGLTSELFAERFQSRMNTVAPVVTALALLPMVVLLRAFDRRRSWSEHLLFILTASNGVWLISLLLLPTIGLGTALHVFVVTAALYAYLGVAFFAVYQARTAFRTALRYALFVAADLALSLVLSAVVFALVYRSVLLF